MKNSATTAQPTSRKHTEATLTPLAATPLMQLTADEVKKGGVIFHLPISVTGLDTDVVAVCEPTGPWQWLPVGALIVSNVFYAWQDDVMPAGQQLFSELATRVVRVQEVSHQQKQVTVFNEFEESETWAGKDMRCIWLITRAIPAQANRLNVAA